MARKQSKKSKTRDGTVIAAIDETDTEDTIFEDRQLVYIEWVDAVGGASGWEFVPSLTKCDLGTVRSVGWIFGESSDAVRLVSHVVEPDDEEGLDTQGQGTILIPKMNIVRAGIIPNVDLAEVVFSR